MLEVTPGLSARAFDCAVAGGSSPSAAHYPSPPRRRVLYPPRVGMEGDHGRGSGQGEHPPIEEPLLLRDGVPTKDQDGNPAYHLLAAIMYKGTGPYRLVEVDQLRAALDDFTEETGLAYHPPSEIGNDWVDKLLPVYRVEGKRCVGFSVRTQALSFYENLVALGLNPPQPQTWAKTNFDPDRTERAPGPGHLRDDDRAGEPPDDDAPGGDPQRAPQEAPHPIAGMGRVHHAPDGAGSERLRGDLQVVWQGSQPTVHIPAFAEAAPLLRTFPDMIEEVAQWLSASATPAPFGQRTCFFDLPTANSMGMHWSCKCCGGLPREVGPTRWVSRGRKIRACISCITRRGTDDCRRTDWGNAPARPV